MSFLSTVKIKVQPCKGNEAGIVVMNEVDYDPKQHELYDPAKEAALKAEESSHPAKAEEQPMTFEEFKGKRGKK